MRVVTIAAAGAVLLLGCETPQAPSGNWLKSGAGYQERNRDTYECEKDVRAAANTFGRSTAPYEANDYFSRCMISKGWAWRSDR